MKILNFQKSLFLVSLSIALCAFSPAQDFSDGELTGWTSIGAVSVVADTYAPGILSGNAALLSTGSGAVPIDQVFAFLESEGVHVAETPRSNMFFHSAFKGGFPEGMVGSAIVSEFSSELDYPRLVAWGLTNDIGENEERGGFALAFRASDGRGTGGAVGLLQDNQSHKWEASSTPFAYQGKQTSGVIPGPDSNGESRRIVYLVWEVDPNAGDAGYALLIEGPPESGEPE